MEPIFAETLIISDLHLGSEVSRAREALQLLRVANFRRLILLGDIFCDLNFRRLRKHHWRFLSEIRRLSNPKRGTEVIWVEGNHDRGLTEVMSHLVGIRVYDEYEWTFSGKRFLAVHGHQFDRFLVNNALLSGIGEWVYLNLQRFDSKQNRLSRFLDRQNSRWLRLSPKVCHGAMDMAREREAHVVICGHTHQAMQTEQEGVQYLNCGCWTASQVPTFITISESDISLREFSGCKLGPADDSQLEDDDREYTDIHSGVA